METDSVVHIYIVIMPGRSNLRQQLQLQQQLQNQITFTVRRNENEIAAATTATVAATTAAAIQSNPIEQSPMQSTLDSQCKHTRRSNSNSISIYPDRYLFCSQVLEMILNTRTHKYKCTKRALTKSRSTTTRDERCDTNTIRRCLRCGTRLCEA